jgi:hypothetical protein
MTGAKLFTLLIVFTLGGTPAATRTPIRPE